MIQGNITLSDSGAVGHPYGRARVMNVAPLDDRELFIDGAIGNWVINGNDTANLTTDPNHVLGPSSLEFDKIDGTENTVYAGVKRANPQSTLYDCSRFLGDATLQIRIKIPSLTDVAQVELRLGTDTSNYQLWSWADTALPANAWTELFARLDAGTIVGTGWNPSDIRYAALLVKFDAETDTLADILVDYVLIGAGEPNAVSLDQVNLTAVTSATNGQAVDTALLNKVTVFVEVSSNTGAVTVNIEASHDGTDWYLLDTKTYTATNDKDTFSYQSHFLYMRATTTSHASATVNVRFTGKK